ncbi:MAG: acyltransferase [Paludibacteraceae bacterium]|nr:acyltransferase [Paludibacteraceae bacterium]
MTRNLQYDVMRVVAIFLVVLQHTWSIPHLDTPEHGLLCYMYGALVSCGVPLFIMVSGALNLRPSVTDAGTFLRKRLVRVFVPFLIWATIIYVLTFFTGGYAEIHSWKDAFCCYLPYLATNRVNASHWFIHLLLVLYLLTPVLRSAFAAGEARKTAGYILIVVFALALLAALYPEMYLLHYTSQLLVYLGLYVAGYYLSLVDLPRQTSIMVGSIGFVVIYAANVLMHRPAYLLIAISAAALFIALQGVDCSRCERSGEPLVSTLSRYSYCIYLMHVPFVRAFYILQQRYMPYEQQWINWLLPVLVAIVTLSLCAALVWCAEKMVGRNMLYLGVARRTDN